jgi:hypothetical protein
MKRLALAVLTLQGVTTVPSQAAPTFFFDRGYDAVAFWNLESPTQRIATTVVFLTSDRGSRPAEKTLTFLSYFTQTQTWAGRSGRSHPRPSHPYRQRR